MYSHLTTALLFSTLALATPSPAAASTTITEGKLYTAAYDALNTASPIPNPFKGLTYNTFSLTTNTGGLKASSPPNMIVSSQQYGMSITSNDLASIKSLDLGCSSCGGSECLAGFYAAPCNITIVGAFDGFPETQVNSRVFEYLADNVVNGSAPLQRFTAAGKGNYLAAGTVFHLFLTGGVVDTQVFIDNLVYEFGYNQ